jgi:hypothetical protein
VVHDKRKAVAEAPLNASPKLVQQRNSREHDSDAPVFPGRKKRIDEDALTEAGRRAQHEIPAGKEDVERRNLLTMKRNAAKLFEGHGFGQDGVALVRGFFVDVVPEA